MNRVVVGILVSALGCTLARASDTPEKQRAYLDWMRQALSEVEPWTVWQTATGELPPDFETLPKSADLPDPLRFADGRAVQTPDDWSARRIEIKRLFERYVTGTFPPKPASFNIVPLDETRGDGCITRNVRLELGPDGRGSLRVQVTMPTTGGPFPVLICPYLGGWASTVVPRGYASVGYAGNDFGDDTVSLKEIYPGYDFADLPRRAWAAQIVVDYLLTLPEIDGARIAIYGYSRDGKMATMAAALDERIAAVIAGSTGVGGVLPWRLGGEYGMGESIESTTRMFPTWFHPRLRFFSGREDRLPVDANLLIALIAPRACLMQYGWNDEVSNAWALERCRDSAVRVWDLLRQPPRLDLLAAPGFHGAIDPGRCLDWLDIQFGRQPGPWRNELHFAWDWESWRRAAGTEASIAGPIAPALASFDTAETWQRGAEAVRASIAATLGERPPYLEAPAPFFRLSRGPTPGPTAGGRGGPGQVTPDVPAWVIGRRIQEFGWLSPEQDQIDSRRIRFGDGATGDLFYPKETPDDARLPTVIWLHGSSYPLGYMWVYRRDLHPILALTRAGFAVLAFDQCGFGARQDEAGAFYQRYPRWSQMGRMTEDVRHAIDALEKEPLVDATRISLFGYTLGGTTALLAGTLDPRVQGVVAISGFTPLRTDTADRHTGGLARYSHTRGLIPRLGFHVGHEQDVPWDFDQVLAALAPRPVLVVQPRLDRGATPADVRTAVERARGIYTLLGASERIALHEPDDYTRLPTATQDRIIAWMKAALTNTTASP